MTAPPEHTLGEGTAAEPPALVWAPGPGHSYPATAGGVPLWPSRLRSPSVLGLVETGILSSAASDLFLATCFGIGLVGGDRGEDRGGELFGGTFGVAYAAFSSFLDGPDLQGIRPDFAAAGSRISITVFAAWLILRASSRKRSRSPPISHQLDRGWPVELLPRPCHRQPRRHGELDRTSPSSRRAGSRSLNSAAGYLGLPTRARPAPPLSRSILES